MTTSTTRLVDATFAALSITGLGGLSLIAELEGLQDERAARHSRQRMATLADVTPRIWAKGTVIGPVEGSASADEVTR